MQDVVYFGVLADAHDFFPIERAQGNPDVRVRVRQVIEVRRESPAADGRASRQFSCYSFLSQFLAKRHHFCASECTYSCGHAAGKGGSAVTCDFPLVFRRARDERRLHFLHSTVRSAVFARKIDPIGIQTLDLAC